MSELAILILAAGKGTRMPQDLPKVLQPVGGAPLIDHVLRTARALAPARILLVLGHRVDEVRAAIDAPDVEIVLQLDPRGTGDAVRRAEPVLREFTGDLLILYGDVPLVRPGTLRDLLERHRLEANAATLLTATLPDATGYGRILRDAHGFCCGIVEQKELAPGQEAIREFNSGIAVFRAGPLFRALARVVPAPRSGEYYLTDVFGLLQRDGERIGTGHLADSDEILGVNTLEQLGEVEAVHARRAAEGSGCAWCDLAARAPAGQAAGAPASALLLAAGERILVAVNPDPFNNGHLLIFPRRHVTLAAGLDGDERRELAEWLQRAESVLARIYGASAFNTGCSSGAGGHLTIHLVPRWEGDMNFLPLVARLKLIPETPRGSWERLREAMR